MLFKIKVGSKVYELPKMTLGEARIMAQHFALEDMSKFNPQNPEQMAGLLYLCIRRERPNASHEDLLAEIDALDIEDFKAAEEKKPDPTVPAEAGDSGPTGS